MTFSLTELL